jgi:hypothetical protein
MSRYKFPPMTVPQTSARKNSNAADEVLIQTASRWWRSVRCCPLSCGPWAPHPPVLALVVLLYGASGLSWGASTRHWPLSWPGAPLAQSRSPSVPVYQERELSLPLRTPSVNSGVYKYPASLPLALETAARLSALSHAKVSGIPSSHAKYPLGSGALSWRGYFA